jgi:hypothetical protein
MAVPEDRAAVGIADKELEGGCEMKFQLILFLVGLKQ